MLKCINIPSDPWSLQPFKKPDDLRRFYTKYGCDGLELILCGEDFDNRLPQNSVIGLHLIFYPEWIALWQEDFAYLDKEFGSRAAWQAFYQATSAEDLLRIYQHEMDIATRLGAQYVVFHIGDNPLHEYYTLRPRRTDDEIIRYSAEFLNAIMAGQSYQFELLLENMWIGGMNLTNPDTTQKMLESVQYPRTGLLLDTGHLTVTNPALRTPDEACRYIHHILDLHASVASCIRGVHLHCSLSGEYLLSAQTGSPELTGDYLRKYSQVTKHLQKIDTHQPFVSKLLPELIERINPAYLVYELSRKDLPSWEKALSAQNNVFKK